MKIGLITNSLYHAGIKSLQNIAMWAYDHGIQDLEVGPGVELDEKTMNDVLNKTDISISSFIYCRNVLSSDETEALHHVSEMKKRIELAVKTGVSKLVCSTGLSEKSFFGKTSINYDPELSIPDVVNVYMPLIELAHKHDILLCFEMCPMMGNAAVSPYMWDILFDRLDSDHVGLAYDPSHLVWQFIEPYSNIIKYKNRIFHFHAKDCEINIQTLSGMGILHRVHTLPETADMDKPVREGTWWRYRLPGLGSLDWNRIVDSLYQIGYSGTISIEHEDPVWEGTLEKVQAGIIRARDHIRRFI